MSTFLDLLESLLEQIYPISGYAIGGGGLLILSGFLSYYSTEKLILWHRMWQPENVVHQPVPPAIERVRDGVVGCLLGLSARILQWICFFVGLDFLLLQARVSQLLAEIIGLI